MSGSQGKIRKRLHLSVKMEELAQVHLLVIFVDDAIEIILIDFCNRISLLIHQLVQFVAKLQCGLVAFNISQNNGFEMLLLIDGINFFRRKRKNDILKILVSEFRKHVNQFQSVIRQLIILVIIYIEESGACFHCLERLFRVKQVNKFHGLEDGRKDHRGLRDADEQGAGGY